MADPRKPLTQEMKDKNKVIRRRNAKAMVRREACFGVLDRIGIHRLCEVYTELAQQKAVLSWIKKESGLDVSAYYFQGWLNNTAVDENNMTLRDYWNQARGASGVVLGDRSLEVAELATPETAKSDGLLIRNLQWQAERRNPAQFGNNINVSGTVKHEHTVSFADRLAEAVLGSTENQEIEEADFEIEEDSPENPASPENEIA